MARAACKFLLICIFALSSCVSGQAQTKVIDLTKSIPIGSGPIRLDALFQKISQHTQLVFTYDASKIKTNKLVVVKSDELSLLQIFTLLRNEASLECKVVEDHVILSQMKPPPESKRPQPKAVIQSKKTDTEKTIRPVETNEDTLRQAGAEKIVNVVSKPSLPDSAGTSSVTKISSEDSMRNVTPEIQVRRDTIVKPSPGVAVIQNSKGRSSDFKIPDFIAKVGLSIDETSTFGANINLGIPFLCGTASWQTNSNVSHARFGVVTSVPLNKNLNLVLGWNTGNLQKTYIVDSVFLTKKYLLSVKSHLTRFFAFVEFPVSKKLYMQIGPQLNLMKTIYYKDSAAINLLSIGPNSDETYFTIKPPYTITKELQPPSTYILNWIGLQASIYYKINLSRL